MAIAAKVCERCTSEFILTEVLALLGGWYSQEGADQVVLSDVALLKIDKAVNLRIRVCAVKEKKYKQCKEHSGSHERGCSTVPISQNMLVSEDKIWCRQKMSTP